VALVSVVVSFVLVKKNGGRLPVETIRKTLSGFDTKTVVFLSDENCVVDQAWMDAIVEGFGYNLILRQYACGLQGPRMTPILEWAEERSFAHPVWAVMPLGFGTEMMRTPCAHGSTSQSTWSVGATTQSMASWNASRGLRWTFIGNVKGARKKALSAFNNVHPNMHGVASKRGVAFAYGNSDFVVSPRGEVNLDCFRHYEASALGAIPIVVANATELDMTFSGIGSASRPPWLFADSWEDAKRMVRSYTIRDEPILIDHADRPTVRPPVEHRH
jgi:hypothetical protein